MLSMSGGGSVIKSLAESDFGIIAAETFWGPVNKKIIISNLVIEKNKNTILSPNRNKTHD